MLKLRRANKVPYGGYRWRCVDPKCPIEIIGRTDDEMVKLAAEHCKANGLPVGLDFFDKTIHEMCEQFHAEGRHICRDVDSPYQMGKGPDRSRFISTEMVKTCLATILAWKVFGDGKLVPVDECERRAEICLSCECHVNVDGCEGCRGASIRKMIEQIGATRPFKHRDLLKVCRVCGCPLKAKVVVPLGPMQDKTPPEWDQQYPDKCWVKKHEPDNPN